MADRLFKIGELAELVGVTRRAIRYYEEIGLLPKPQRSERNYRLYPPEQAQTLRLIKGLRSCGVGLEAIAQIIDVQRESTGNRARCEELIGLLETAKGRLNWRIEELKRTIGNIEFELSHLRKEVIRMEMPFSKEEEERWHKEHPPGTPFGPEEEEKMHGMIKQRLIKQGMTEEEAEEAIRKWDEEHKG